ncbi:hypothetical protein AB0F91_39900 [Amycolatopsis sp. NPDC023774]|uniref:hypothetical protein n=1 Tax=Amycolatopsis sp. NPDC023774 TaxID=3155015 RepID=UPI00340B15DC
MPTASQSRVANVQRRSRAATVQRSLERYWSRVRRAEQNNDLRAKFDAAVDLLRTALTHASRERRDLTLAQLTTALAKEAEAIHQRYVEGPPQ